MKLKSTGRAALIVCASLVLGLGISSCATSTLGFLFVSSTEFGQVASLRLGINTGRIVSTTCNTHNGDQQNCNTGSGGSNPTKLLITQGDQYLYVLNAEGNGVNQASIGVFTLGPSGGVYPTGEVYSTTAQNPIDMYVGLGGSFIYVLNQYQPSPANGGTVAACSNPTPTTCPGAITVFQIGNNGSLSLVQNTSDGASSQNPLLYFPVGYVPNPVIPQDFNGTNTPSLPNSVIGQHLLLSGSYMYLLDNNISTGAPQVDIYNASSTTGQLTLFTTGATQNSAFVTPTSMIQGGSYVFVADSSTGLIWEYIIGSGGALTPASVGSFCPADPTTTTYANQVCLHNSTPGITSTLPVALSAMTIDSSNKFLYAADYNNGTVFSMQIVSAGAGSGGNILAATTDGGGTPLGTNTTCMTVSSGTEFLYTAGSGSVDGIQVDTNSGNLTDSDHPRTSSSFSGLAPCLVFSSRT